MRSSRVYDALEPLTRRVCGAVGRAVAKPTFVAGEGAETLMFFAAFAARDEVLDEKELHVTCLSVRAFIALLQTEQEPAFARVAAELQQSLAETADYYVAVTYFDKTMSVLHVPKRWFDPVK